MKFFIDTAKVEDIKKAKALGILDGVTTNPSLVAATGKSFDDVIKEIVPIVDGWVNLEVISTTKDEIIEEAKKLSKIHKNVIVKIPFIPEGVKAVTVLSKEGIKTNLTLVFSPNQALIGAKAGANYVSPFIGRFYDISYAGMELITQILTIFRNYSFKTEVIVASVRDPVQVVEAAIAGAQNITLPLGVLEKMFKHPLTDSGLKKFMEDWEKVPK